MMKKILLLFLGWRVLLLIISGFAPAFLPYRLDFAYTTYSSYLEQPTTGWQKILEPWANFDGVHYLNIAQRGYIDEWRFFPLLPILIHSISFGNESVMLVLGFILTQVIIVVALYWLYKLLQLDYPEKIAVKTVICLLAFPMSFFLGSVYTEGLFLLLTVSALYAARKKRWGIAVVAAALASSTRVVGIVLVPTLLIELWLQHSKAFKSFLTNEWKKICLIGGGALGLIAYCLYLQQQTGDPLLFLKAHTLLGNSRSVGLILPAQTAFRYIKILLTLSPNLYEWWIALLEVGVFVTTAGFLIWSWFLPIRKSYWWFAFMAYLIPSLSGTFTGLPRYVAILFPLFLPLVLTKKKWVFATYVIVAIPWLIIFSALFSRGYFVA